MADPMMSWVESCEVTITRNEQVITYNAVVRRKGGTDQQPLYDVHLAGARELVVLLVATGEMLCSCERHPCPHRPAVLNALAIRGRKERLAAMERSGAEARKAACA